MTTAILGPQSPPDDPCLILCTLYLASLGSVRGRWTTGPLVPLVVGSLLRTIRTNTYQGELG